MFLEIPLSEIGPPIDWNLCLWCMKEMEPEEERHRIEVAGKVGIGHKQCQDEQLGKVLIIRARASRPVK